MITDRIGLHSVLLPINHNLDEFVIYKALFKIKTQEIPRFFASSEKKPFTRAPDTAYYPIT